MDPLISGPDHPRWTDPQFLALAQHKQEAAMPQFRKKPVVIEAMQYTLEARDEIVAWCGAQGTAVGEEGEVYELRNLRIETLEGVMLASPGDWIIKGIKGEFYPCKPDIFAATYEPASTPAATIPDGYMLVPIKLPPGIVTQATPAVEFPDKPGNMVQRCWRLLLSALQAKGY